MKHLLGRGLIDFAVRVEDVHAPLFICKPGEHTRLDRGEVSHDEPAARLRDKGCTNELGQRSCRVIEEHLESLKITLSNQAPRGVKLAVRHLVLRQVLHLHQTPGPASGARGTAELSQASDATVRANRAEHRVVFFS